MTTLTIVNKSAAQKFQHWSIHYDLLMIVGHKFNDFQQSSAQKFCTEEKYFLRSVLDGWWWI